MRDRRNIETFAARLANPLGSAGHTGVFLGLRDLGPWWAELYRLPGNPDLYLVQLLAGHGRPPDFDSIRLEFGGGTRTAMATKGSRLFGRAPAGVPASAAVRIVAEQRDGTVLTAAWQ